VLLRTMLGLHRPNQGVVSVHGQDITAMSERQLLAVKRRYGVTFQHGALFTALTVAENVQLPLREHFSASEATLQALTELRLRMVGLPLDAGGKLPSQLSGGMIKRAGLARALALDPTILFLDEPTSGLDPISAAAFDKLILYLQKSLRLTVVMITHDLDTIMATCDRVAVLVDKKMVVATLDRIMQNPHPWIHQYFHGPRARTVQAQAAARATDGT
jgi:phospholipid/cholesterol/gamma-HCH transport system ATP-binding protein